MVAIKNNLQNYCTENPTDCKACLWFTIDKSVFNIDKNILCGALYLPPEGSRYSDIGLFDELENELMYLNTNNQHHVVLMGDFNSRTRTMNDFISMDIELLNDIKLDNAICDILEDEQTLDCLGIPTKRLSLDVNNANNYGMRLIEFCKSNAMYIFNGRVGTDRYAGNFTTTKNSIIDYVIGSPFILSITDGFKIAPFDPMFSDIHCAIEFSLKQATLTHKEAKQTHIDVNSADI